MNGSNPARRSFHTDIGPSIKTLAVPSLPQVQMPTDVSELKAVGSYNWLDVAEKPTIVVPGSPAIWRDCKLPFRLPKDTKAQYVDINARQNPTFPLAPVIIATKLLTPRFNFNSVDIITSRNNLRKLFKWVKGECDKDFRIDVEVVQKTIILTRYEQRVMLPARPLGSGHEFKMKMTQCDIKVGEGIEVLSHNRVLSFKWQGLSFLLTSITDACIVDPVNDVTTSLTSHTISERVPDKIIDDPAGIQIIKQSRPMIPQQSIIMLKTRSELTPFGPADVFDQLSFSQTPHLFVGRHKRGVFFEVEDHKLEEMALAREEVEEGMQKVGSVLQEIKRLALELTRSGKQQLMSLVCQDGVLVLFARTGGVLLPVSMKSYFE